MFIPCFINRHFQYRAWGDGIISVKLISKEKKEAIEAYCEIILLLRPFLGELLRIMQFVTQNIRFAPRAFNPVHLTSKVLTLYYNIQWRCVKCKCCLTYNHMRVTRGEMDTFFRKLLWPISIQYSSVLRSLDDAVGIVNSLWAGQLKNNGSSHGKGKEFFPLYSVKTGNGAHPGFFPQYINRDVNLTTYLHLVSRLRMRGTIPVLPHVPLQTEKGQIYNYIILQLRRVLV
jgi:hypothetical protein